MNSSDFLPTFWRSDFERILSARYPNRKISRSDPTPIPINDTQLGPLKISGGYVMCDFCGVITRSNYLNYHRSSGACRRKINGKNNSSTETSPKSPHNPQHNQLNTSIELVLDSSDSFS